MPAYSGFVDAGRRADRAARRRAWTGPSASTRSPACSRSSASPSRCTPRERAHALLAIVLVAGSPVAYLALDAGHPEDVLAAAAATAGVLAAVRQQATLSAVLLTVAVLAKQTAVLALLPAALALPKPKLRVLAVARRRRAAGLRRPPARPPRRRRGHTGARRRLVLPSLAGLVAARRPVDPGVGRRRPRRHHLARLAGADPAPADRRPRAPAQPRSGGGARGQRPPARGRARPVRPARARALPARPVEPRLLPPAAGARARRVGDREAPPAGDRARRSPARSG